MNEINQRRMQYFYEVLTQGSIREAAETLNTAPSVVTRQIRLLEKELAVTLFERHPRGLQPNEASEIVLEYCRSCHSHQKRLETYLQEMRELQRGYIRLAVNQGYIGPLMDDVLNDFCRQYPRLKIHVETVLTNEAVTQVMQDIAHIGLAHNPPDVPELRSCARAKRLVRLVVGKNHVLARQHKVTVADVLRYPLALFSSSAGLSQILQALEESEKIRLTPTLTTNSITVLERFVNAGKGVAFMVTSLKPEVEEVHGLVPLEVENLILSNTESRLFVRRGRPLSAAVNQLVRQIITQLSLFK
ncbi:LysR family regulatory helix-turn-helix protein 77 [Mycoavidus cysteinexigens]|uniref:LysR family regulatory helix-turn-helix protein 77 n=1 Tax=Mycoavidus cysteinexigens TaxID=1553431 RepID=A0A2Z6EWP3_9BURK|nr:LysR family transcriptional regulator [Mycoavidus cysteinexigens]BBE09836.1 LysR family regulatory helix-turn-helix protein 77 [Mycoavidus cysteinexigens]GAM53820.1 transcriptional regulators, LysR family [bacterium endosymbiont of Mortierella elongata FMR23-6]GLR01737.1 LysR family transcriptional regulator [Mycoavidus cysteinexigens]